MKLGTLAKIGLPVEGLVTESRTLLFDYPRQGYVTLFVAPQIFLLMWNTVLLI